MIGKFKQNKSKQKKIIVDETYDDDDDDDQLTIDDLQILINQLYFQDESGSFPKRLESLQKLSKCISRNQFMKFDDLPPPIMAQLHHFIFNVATQQQNTPEINQTILIIITMIYNTFNEQTDDKNMPENYPALINFIWQLIPSEEAFEALSLISSQNLTAAMLVFQHKDEIFSWLSNPDLIHNALILINSLISKKGIRSNFEPFLNNFLDLSQILEPFDLQILYSILGYYCQNKKGVDSIQNYQMIGNLFEKGLANPEIFYEALRLVEEVNMRVKSPLLFMEKSNTLSFFEKSLSSSNEKILLEGLNLCLSVADDAPVIEFMFQNGIIDRLFNLINTSTTISSYAIEIVCRIVSEGPSELLPQFLDKGIIDIVTLYFPIVDARCKNEMLKILQTIVKYFEKTGNQEAIDDLATDELSDALSEVRYSDDNPAIWDIANYVYKIIFHNQP